MNEDFDKTTNICVHSSYCSLWKYISINMLCIKIYFVIEYFLSKDSYIDLISSEIFKYEQNGLRLVMKGVSLTINSDFKESLLN